VSPIEHPAVREAALSMRDWGVECEFLPITSTGVIEPTAVAAKIRPDTILVSVIAANNQFGTIQDLTALGRVCRERKVLFHTDASVYFGLYSLDVQAQNLDLVTLSSPKLYGPKGVAALYRRGGIALYPLLHGGGQEFGLRSGTHNLPAIVGFAAAAKTAVQKQPAQQQKYRKLSEHFVAQVRQRIPQVLINGDPQQRLVNNVHVSVLGAEGESLVLGLNQYGIAATSGSACSSRKLQPDMALKALGMSPEAIHGSLRFFWHEWTTKADIDYLVEKLTAVVTRLREISAYKIDARNV
jgi:cysteine desulfurase